MTDDYAKAIRMLEEWRVGNEGYRFFTVQSPLSKRHDYPYWNIHITDVSGVPIRFVCGVELTLLSAVEDALSKWERHDAKDDE